jgi:WD40 repeat protein
MAWSPDNEMIAVGSSDYTVRLWNVKRQQNFLVLRGHDNWVRSVAFSRDGSQLCSIGRDGKVRVWNVRTSILAATLNNHDLSSSPLRGATWSPDGKMLATVSFESVVLWDVSARKVLARRRLQWQQGQTREAQVGLGFSPDGRLLAVPCGEMVRVYDVASRAVAADLKGHAGRVRWVEFSADGTRLASASEDGTVLVWGLDSDETGPAR